MYRCGVKKPDYPSVRDKCYCLEKKPGPERSDAGDGVKNGFWHKMEVLSLPWHQDLFWPNTSMFKVRLVTHFVQECGANTDHCTVKHHTDIINFACMTWNFVRISASLSALCTNFYLFDIGIAFLAKFYPILM